MVLIPRPTRQAPRGGWNWRLLLALAFCAAAWAAVVIWRVHV